MDPILSRLLVRVAILAASLAWAGFVFIETIGDPGRGERIAVAVLDDGEARAEVAAPITRAVMSTTGLPPEQQPLVAGQVDRLLQDPRGAQTFIDPFAGSWARLLGEDDPRPTEFDLVPLLELATASLPPGTADTTQIAGQLPVTGVPLPRNRLDWMGGFRQAVSVSIVPLALVAFGAFLTAFVIGDRPRVLRRFGVWAVAAGLTWVAIPPLVVWAARRWAPGADAVVAVSLDEATSGLLPVAIALVGAGLTAFATSFVVTPDAARRGAPRPAPASRPRTDPRPYTAAPARPAPAQAAPATRTMPVTPPATHTAEIPATQVMPQRGAAPTAHPADPTAELPAVDRARRPDGAGEPAADDDRDALWDYYGTT